MADVPKLQHPWLVAVWPGMGNVAMSAGYYLMAKLGMHLLAEFSARELFDVEHIEVKGGLIHTGRLPRSRLFVWTDPLEKHDIVVFIGEAQPPRGKYAFCRRLMEYAQQIGVERVFTFAAMATAMHPQQDPRVFGAATDEQMLAELRQYELEILEDGNIGGLNGVLLGAASDMNMSGLCLLGEMPHIFAQLPFPMASLAVLRVFTSMTGIRVDFAELEQQAQTMEESLGELLEQVQRAIAERASEEEDEEDDVLGLGLDDEQEKLSEEDEQRIERLFDEARQDRSKAYVLKRELDRLDVFSEFEDRFLDLFKKRE